MKPAPVLEAAKSNLVFEVLRDLRLIVSSQSAENPTDQEWDAWLAAAKALGEGSDDYRVLALTEGGHPNRDQVSRLTEAMRDAAARFGKQRGQPRTVLISSSAAIRFIISALTLLNPNTRCLAPAALDEAFAFLGLTAQESRQAGAAIERLRAKLDATSSTAE